MDSRAKLAGHAIHPMLVVFPLGLLVTAFIFDIVYLVNGAAHWGIVSFWMIGAGIIGGLIAALFGWIDWFAIPVGTRAKSIGLTHGLGNVVVLALFAVSWFLRRGHEEIPGVTPIVLAGIGVVCGAVPDGSAASWSSGWESRCAPAQTWMHPVHSRGSWRVQPSSLSRNYDGPDKSAAG
jgi:Predicted membrane protein